MSKKKSLSPRLKVAILRKLLENQIPMSRLAEKYQIHVNDIYNWKKKLFEQAPDNIFALNANKSKIIESKKDEKIRKLEEKVKQKDEVIAEIVRQKISVVTCGWQDCSIYEHRCIIPRVTEKSNDFTKQYKKSAYSRNRC